MALTILFCFSSTFAASVLGDDGGGGGDYGDDVAEEAEDTSLSLTARGPL